jgi:hypothetical protein
MAGRTKLAGEERHDAVGGGDGRQGTADHAALGIEEEGKRRGALAGLDLFAAVDEDELKDACYMLECFTERIQVTLTFQYNNCQLKSGVLSEFFRGKVQRKHAHITPLKSMARNGLRCGSSTRAGNRTSAAG